MTCLVARLPHDRSPPGSCLLLGVWLNRRGGILRVQNHGAVPLPDVHTIQSRKWPDERTHDAPVEEGGMCSLTRNHRGQRKL
jgi:hypothetical protein